MAPYPTSHEIEDIFKLGESPDSIKKFDERLAPNLHVKIQGEDHHLSGEHKGSAAWIQDSRSQIAGLLDYGKPTHLEVNAIGGGDNPWAAVEVHTTGTAKSGKAWNHATVAIVRFNEDGKIITARIYLDTKHVDSHIDAAKK